jgi:exosome complex component RRP42
MASILVSEAEKVYVLHGVQEDLRVDGRRRSDLRPLMVESDLVTHTSGSAHLRLANTDVLVGVKAELDATLPERPGDGRLVFSVDCSANATPEFEGRGGEDLATEISRLLGRAYGHKSVFDLDQLIVLEGVQCWVLYIDILILECGGNLFDAVSMAVKAALHSTRIPNVTVTWE